LGGILNRFSPMRRFGYRITRDISIEGESGAETTHQIDSQGIQADSTRKCF
jgi:hypothetical protein